VAEEGGEIWLYALLAGLGIGFLIAKIADPVEEEIVESIAESEWAREWAEKFCGGPPEVRKECIERVKKEIARKLAQTFGLI